MNVKKGIIKHLISIFFLSIFIFATSLVMAQSAAKNEVRLYNKFTGTGGLNQYGWFLKNKSTSQAIKVTIKFTDRTKTQNNTRTESFSLEPGDDRWIAVKFQHSFATRIDTAANIVGARYL